MISAKLNGYKAKPWKIENEQQVLSFNGKTNYLKIGKEITDTLDIKTELNIDVEFKVNKAGFKNKQSLMYKGGSFQISVDKLAYLHFAIKIDGKKWVNVKSDRKLIPGVWNSCTFTYDHDH